MLGGRFDASRAIELLRKLPASGCEGLHRLHDRVAMLHSDRGQQVAFDCFDRLSAMPRRWRKRLFSFVTAILAPEWSAFANLK